MKISVDYSEVYQASVYVKNKADSYNDLIQNLYKRVEQMQSIWQSPASKYFMEQFQTLNPAMMSYLETLTRFSTYLHQTANLYQENEQNLMHHG